jgi:hypothetical protein
MDPVATIRSALKLLLFVALMAPTFPALSQNAQELSQAEAAAMAWVLLVDEGRADTSWQQSATMFRAGITESKWDSKVRAVREPLGSVRSRSLEGAAYSHDLHGAPGGDYVLVTYHTQFEHRVVVEKVAVVHEIDASWHVGDYTIN